MVWYKELLNGFLKGVIVLAIIGIIIYNIKPYIDKFLGKKTKDKPTSNIIDTKFRLK